MMKKLAVAFGIAFLMSGAAFAKPDTVPGAGCPVCHDGPPPKKVLTAKAKAMMTEHKELSTCKNCHAKGEGGKMTSKK